MPTVIVTEKALRELVREAMFNPGFSGWSSNLDGPTDVNPVTDPSAAVTDPINPSFTPQTKTEFGIAVNQLVKNLPDTQMPSLFDTVKTAIDTKETKEDEEEMTKKVAAGGTGVEEAVRRAVRKQLAQINPRWDTSQALAEARPDKKLGPVVGDLPPVKKIPAGQHGGEWNKRSEKHLADLKKILKKDPTAEPAADAAELADAAPGEETPQKTHKVTAIGGMEDVGGLSFEEIAKSLSDDLRAEAEQELADAELNGEEPEKLKTTAAVSGAKRIADEALKKAHFLCDMDPEDLEIIVHTAMNDYIKYLTKSGELTPADVQLMKDHPNIIRDLDGFREFLHNSIRRARREDQKLLNPAKDDDSSPALEEPEDVEQMPEADGSDTELKMKSAADKHPVAKPASSSNKTKAKSLVAGGDLEVDWGGMDESKRPVLRLAPR
jgi:hypothetical protein